ncbi:antibiotic biosynthesis monooxygenase family protein [Evansella tamaricis]|uniref:Antibiotic biosynthesis monooxygenase n=1 Tax=Evansella tamaricis TaxID=2069301 RepID=A0ABS6JGG6_9BACI|nr:antibiotic biosynthesis monooxygenase [Evansella tamaricis]MBU9712737.1 antibiotic biosynthesis monooxygenase [Evansella tamaricis]
MYIYLTNKERTLEKLDSEPKIFRLTLKGEDDLLHLVESDSMIELELTESDLIFEVIDASSSLQKGAFLVCNNIPVVENGRKVFEQRFQNRARMIENEPGFVAIRVCRPLNSDTYVIMTFWEKEQDFLNWKQSSAYEHAHKKRGTSEGIDMQKPQIFPRPSFVETYDVLL